LRFALAFDMYNYNYTATSKDFSNLFSLSFKKYYFDF
jgi:hypothetical protein